jgi:hypothetical protein
MVMIGAIAIGVICGLVPLVFGLVTGRTNLAVGGFVGCVVAGILAGVLAAVPVAAVFAWLIWRQSRPVAPAADGEASTTGPPVDAAGERRFEREPERDREPSARR